MRRLLAISALLAAAAGCVDIYRGAIVQLKLVDLPASRASEHYELFAVVNGGAVEIQRFKVLDARSDCGADPELTPLGLRLVQAYDNGLDQAGRCDPDRRLGTVDIVVGARPLGGVRIDTPVDLGETPAMFLTIEPDGDSDPQPASSALFHADIGRGLDPLHAADDPPPPTRRGVLLGTLLATAAAEPAFGTDRFGGCVICRDTPIGEIAIVPAEDETFF